MKKLYLALTALLSCGIFAAQAQVAAYSFAQSSGTYSPNASPVNIATATSSSGATALDDVSYPLSFPTGFSFNFNGADYTSCNVNTNGNITFGGSYTSYTPISAGTSYAGAISPFGKDLIASYDGAGIAGEINYQVTGSSPNQVLTIEWKNFRPYSTSTSNVYGFSFQVKLSQTTGQIQFVYGPSANLVGTSTSSGNAQVGLRGASNSAFINRTNPATATFGSSTAGTTYSAGQAYNIAAATPGMPASGLTYTFTPPSCAAPGGLAVTSATPTSVTLTWGAPSVAPSDGYDYYYSETTTLPVATTTPSGSTAAGVTTATVSSLASNTKYYFYVRSKCGAGVTSAWSLAYSYTTPCATVTTYPYTQGFETMSLGTTISDCFTSNGVSPYWTIRTGTTPSSPTGPSGAHTGSQYAFIETSGGAPAGTAGILTSSGFDVTSLTVPYLSYYYHMFGADINKLVVEVNSGSGWVAVDSLVGQQQSATSDPFLLRGVNLSAFSGVLTIRFLAYQGASFLGDIAIDDITMQEAPTCIAPTALNITDGTMTSATVNWTAPTSAPASGYEIFVGTASTAPAATATPTGSVAAGVLSYTAGSLMPSTTYYPFVRSVCSSTDHSNWVAGPSFYTGYCIPTYGTGCSLDDYIDSFSLNGAAGTSISDAPTGCSTGAYDDRTSESVTLLAGATHTGAISSGTSGDNARIWIDFNDNLVFEAGEQVGTVSDINDAGVSAFNVTLPATATVGTHRMRVRLVYSTTAGSIDPCTNYGYGETHDYTANVVLPTGCVSPNALTAYNVDVTTASVKWSPSPAGTAFATFDYEVRTSGAAGSGATGLVASGAAVVDTFADLTGLSGSTTYNLYVRTNCSGGSTSDWSGPATFNTLLSNDLPSGAITLTVGAGCSGVASNTNVGASASTGEPFASCASTSGYSTVWYKFVAPASGMIRASTDGYEGTLTDTKIAIFEATDSSDFTTFNILACDEDGGVNVGFGYTSIAYATGLTPGATYYVVVDKFSTFNSDGTFCVTVDDVTSAMLSTATACADIDGSDGGYTSGYTGWVNLNEADGKLGVLVKNVAGGSASDFYGQQNIDAGGARTSGTESFIAHNWSISNASASTDYQVKLIFPTTETTELGTALGALSVTKVDGAGSTCATTFTPYPGDDTLLTPSLTGSANGVDFVQIAVPSFSQFFVHNGTVPLSLSFESIAARNEGAINVVSWKTAGEIYGNSFELERSIDGAHFSRIATVAARGTASAYDYTDAQPANGINYYRIRIMLGSSHVGYSKVVTATAKSGEFEIAAFPNPTSKDLNIKIAGGISGNAIITITDVLGKTVQTINTVNNTMTINMQQFAAGVYFVKYQDDAHTQTIKVKKD